MIVYLIKMEKHVYLVSVDKGTLMQHPDFERISNRTAPLILKNTNRHDYAACIGFSNDQYHYRVPGRELDEVVTELLAQESTEGIIVRQFSTKTVPEGTLCIGNCTIKHKKSGIFVSGCPPVSSEILKEYLGAK